MRTFGACMRTCGGIVNITSEKGFENRVRSFKPTSGGTRVHPPPSPHRGDTPTSVYSSTSSSACCKTHTSEDGCRTYPIVVCRRTPQH